MGLRQVQPIQGIVGSNGTISMTFESPQTGYIATGTVTMYNSPNGAVWSIFVGYPQFLTGTGIPPIAPIATTKGTAPIGGIQCNEDEVVTVQASGLPVGLVVNANFAYVLETVAEADAVAPIPPAQGIFQSGDARIAAAGQMSTPYGTFSPSINFNLCAGERSIVFLGYNVTPGHAQFTNLEVLVSGNSSLVNWTGNAGFTTSSITNPIGLVNSYEPLTIPIYGVEDSSAQMQLSGFGSVTGTALIQYVILALPDAVLTGTQSNPLIVQQVSPTTPIEVLAGVFFDAIVAGTKDTPVNASSATGTFVTLTPAPLSGALNRVGSITLTNSTAAAQTLAISGATTGINYLGVNLASATSIVAPFDAQVNEALRLNATGGPVSAATYYRELALVNNLV